MKRFCASPFMMSYVIVAALCVVAFAAKPGDWPGWRGPNRDGRSSETGLLKEWPADGPAIAWQIKTAGVGYSSMAVVDGRVITQGDLDGVEHIIAFSEKDGSTLWAVQPEPVAKALAERVDGQFARFDKDQDGKLDELEALAALGWNFNQSDSPSDGDKTQIAKKRAELLIKAFDKNDDGKLAFSEAPRTMQRELANMDRAGKDVDAAALAEKRAKTLIDANDKDDDSKVSQQESRGSVLAFLFRRIDKRDPKTNRGDGQLTLEETRTYFAKREPGRDGEIASEELQAYFEQRFPGRDGVLIKADLRRYYGGYRNGRGNGPRGTVTVQENRIYAEGGNGDVTCLDAKTGKTIWHVNLTRDLKGRRPGWGYSESPLIDGDNLIVTPGGGDGTVAALNKLTGEVVWRSTEVKDGAHYSSPIVADVEGVRQIIQFTRNRVIGLDAKNGELLWSYAKSANGTANCCTPIYSDGHVFSSSDYGTGGGLIKLTRQDDKFTAEEVYFEKSMTNHHGGIVLVDGYMYGFGSGGLICMDFKTGEIAWRNRSVNKGSLCFADGDLYCLGERNAMALVTATPKEYVEKGRVRLPRSGLPTWAHPVVANGRFYFRDQQTLTCYKVSASK